MNSRFQSIFLASVVNGALGLAFADTISKGVNGGVGFIVGLLGSFAFLSFLATISDISRLRDTANINETNQNQILTTIAQRQQQKIKLD